MPLYNKIKKLLFPLTVKEQEEEYLKINGYPKETVRFSDRSGRLTQLIGSNLIMETYEKYKKSILNEK